MMDDKAFMRAITRLRKGDQYLKRERGQTDNQSDLAGMHYTVWLYRYYLVVLEVHRKVGSVALKVNITRWRCWYVT